MATKKPARKTASRAKPRSQPRKKRSDRSRARRRRSTAVWLWLALVLAVIATIWWMREWRQPIAPAAEAPAPPDPDRLSSSGEYPAEPATSVEDVERATAGSTEDVVADRGGDPPVRRGDDVRLAIVIDDLGRSVADAQRLFRLNSAISFAILPFETKTAQVVEVLDSLGAETLLHLPMQASGPQNPGPGALRVGMSAAEIIAATESALAQVGNVSGVNNHMGSAFSESKQAMQPVIATIADRDLFFLDSRTSASSVGFSLAREYGVAAAQRTVFLDNNADAAAVEEQFDRLLEEGRRQGAAIAIGHPYASTMSVLERRLPEAISLGFEIVRVSELLERSSTLY